MSLYKKENTISKIKKNGIKWIKLNLEKTNKHEPPPTNTPTKHK